MSQQASTSEEVLSYLFDESAHVDGLASLVAKYPQLTDRDSELASLEASLVLGEITFTDVETMAGQAFGMDEATRRSFVRDFVGYLVLPIRAFLPELMTAFEAIGGKISDYPARMIAPAKTPADQIAEEILAKVDLESDVLEKRLKLILVQYLKHERDAAKTVDMLTREPSIGGMGLTQDIAQNIVKSVDTRLASGVRVEGVAYDDEAKVAPTEVQVPAPAPIPAIVAPATPKLTVPISIKVSTAPTTVDDDVSLELPMAYDVEERAEAMQEIKELPALEAIVAPPSVSMSVPVATVPSPVSAPASSAVTRSAEAAVAVTHALATTIPVINGEFMTEEERAEVDQHRMPAEEAEKMVEGDINTLSREGRVLIEKLWPTIKSAALTKAAFGPLVESVLRGVRTTTQLGEQLKERYRFTEDQVVPISSAIDKEIADRRNSHKQKHLERQRLLKEAEELERQAKAKEIKEIEEPPKPLEPAKVEVSMPSVHPALHGEQKVTDVLYKKRTVGPIDELGTMTPADFRMLASRPQDLADIILGKVETIAEDGYEEHLKAMRAWKQSPTNALYVRLLRDAMMQQKPLPEIIAAERAKGQEVLSPAEIDAVMTINKRLQ